MTIVLEASNGAAPSHHAKAMLPAGRGEVAVRFRAGELALLGAEGPLAIRTAMLFDHDDRESPLVHRRDDIGTTRPYALAALDLGDISFTERNRATGIDRDGDGRFEAIRAEVGVRIQVPARYEWHGELQDADGRKMERATGTARLGAGTTTVALEFDAAPVTAACARAPFAIQLFLIYAVDEPGAPRPLPWRSKFEGIPLGRISADQLEGGERCPKALFPELAVTSVTATPGPMPGYFTMSVTVTATSATTRSTKVALYRTADLAASERETLGLWLVPPLAAGESASERRRYEIPRERFAVLAVIEDGGIIAVQSGRRATPASEKGKSWNGVAVSPEALRPPGPPRP